MNLRLLGRENRGLCCGEVVMSYRLHGGQQTKSPARLFRAHMAAIEEPLGHGGLMEDPVLLAQARRHWAGYFGRFMPQEILRAVLQGRSDLAWTATQTYFRGSPRTLLGQLRYPAQRLTRAARVLAPS